MGSVESDALHKFVCYHLYLKANNTKHDKKDTIGKYKKRKKTVRLKIVICDVEFTDNEDRC